MISSVSYKYRLLTLLTHVNMENAFGSFDLVEEEMEDDLYLLHDEDILASLDFSSLVPVSVQDNKIIERELKVSDMECLPSPETPATASGAKRFKSVSELELNEFQDARQSTSTKKNTKWGIRLFQGRPK